LYNIVYFVLLTCFVYNPELLSVYFQPLAIALSVLFFIPSLFPPYTPAFLGYLAIDIVYLISFIFRTLAFKDWPYLSMDAVTLLLNSRTLLAFLPLIQMSNIILLSFPLPRLRLIFRLFFPLLPILILGFIGFFLTLYFLGDTHLSLQRAFDILLRTVLLDTRPDSVIEFHPVASRIAYFLMAFSSLWFFWGIGIAGVGMKIVQETDWHLERVRNKAVRLLRYQPMTHVIIKRKGVLGRGKVLSSMPFNVIETIGVVCRVRGIKFFALYLGMAVIVFGWGVVMGVVIVGYHAWRAISRWASRLLDEFEEPVFMDVDSEEEQDERTRLISSLED
jgi:hypothetical protein